MKRFRLEYLGGLDFVALDIRIQNTEYKICCPAGNLWKLMVFTFHCSTHSRLFTIKEYIGTLNVRKVGKSDVPGFSISVISKNSPLTTLV